MPRNLVLVANSSRARFLRTDRAMVDATVLDEIEHPESRAHAGDLVTDRQGRLQKAGARSAYEAHTSPHDVEVDAFARQLAQRLGEHLRETPNLPAIVVAPPAMLGRLRAHFDHAARESVFLEVRHDYTGLPQGELLGALRAQM